MSPSPAAPWLLCWQGLLATEQASRLRKLLPQIAGGMLCALLLVLPMATRTGLGLLIAACGLLWLVWGLATPAVQRPLGPSMVGCSCISPSPLWPRACRPFQLPQPKDC